MFCANMDVTKINPAKLPKNKQGLRFLPGNILPWRSRAKRLTFGPTQRVAAGTLPITMVTVTGRRTLAFPWQC